MTGSGARPAGEPAAGPGVAADGEPARGPGLATTARDAAREPAAGPAGWWRDAVVYQVYLRSFADGNGDGIGDLPGLRARLPYLAELGVDALWITPWYRSPMADGGYDVADLRSIDPTFGTLEDAEALIADAHALGLRVLVDIVPNHTSSEHAWFRAALAGGLRAPERARYVFREGRGPDGALPPNDWPSAFGGPAWTRIAEPDGRPGPWYLHLFAPEQPDLDWTHPDVRADFRETLRFWFDRGIDGFRVDVAMSLVKAPGLPDLRPEDLVHHGASTWAGPDHPYLDREDVHAIWREWRAIAEEEDPPRVFVGEVAVVGPERLARYVRPDELNLAFNFDVLKSPWDAASLRATIDATTATLRAVGAPATWVLSNHDEPRHLTRFGWPETGWRHPLVPLQGDPDLVLGERRARAAILLLLALPGTVFLYQGEELGLEQVLDIPDHLLQDPTWQRSGHTVRGRDGCRVPLPWDGAAAPFGFSPAGTVAAPWLPQPAAWRDRTASAQESDPGSMLTLYRAALRLRRGTTDLRDPGFTWGESPRGTLLVLRGRRFACAVNLGAASPMLLPPGRTTLLRSDGDTGDRLPSDTAEWFLA